MEAFVCFGLVPSPGLPESGGTRIYSEAAGARSIGVCAGPAGEVRGHPESCFFQEQRRLYG